MTHSKQKYILSQTAFTLVELIVVVAILVVLSTVGFVGYSGYSTGSRDTTRTADLKNIYQALKVVQANTGTTPTPDTALTITNASGALHMMQGKVGTSVRNTINLESGGRDPKSGSEYSYTRYSDKKHIQLMAFFETDGYQERLSLTEGYSDQFASRRDTQIRETSPHGVTSFGLPTAHADNIDLFPATIGTELGIMLDTTTQIPLDNTLSGSVSLSTLAASGATAVGSPIAGTGSSVIVTPTMIGALSTPLATNGALTAVIPPVVPPVISLAETLFGSGSSYTTGWTSNTCDPNAMTVVEVNPGNFASIESTQLAGGAVPQNTIFNFANGTYTFPGTLYITRCSWLIGESETGTIFSFTNNSGFLIGLADGPYWNYAPTFSIISKITLNQNGGNWPWYYIQAPGVNNSLSNITFNWLSWTVMAVYSGGVNNPNILTDITLNGVSFPGIFPWY